MNKIEVEPDAAEHLKKWTDFALRSLENEDHNGALACIIVIESYGSKTTGFTTYEQRAWQLRELLNKQERDT